MHHRVAMGGRDHLRQPVPQHVSLDGGEPRQPAGRRHQAARHGREGRLVELDDHPGAGDALGHVGRVGGRTFGQRGGQVGHRAGIGDRHVHRARQLQRGGQRPGPAQLDLDRPAEAVQHLFQDVQVGGEHGPGPGQVAARPFGQAPAARGDLDRDVDQQRGGPAGQVRARPAIGKFRKVREIGKFPGDNAHRPGRIGPGHRADPGGASGRPGKARPVMVIKHMSSLEPPADKPAISASPGVCDASVGGPVVGRALYRESGCGIHSQLGSAGA